MGQGCCGVCAPSQWTFEWLDEEQPVWKFTEEEQEQERARQLRQLV